MKRENLKGQLKDAYAQFRDLGGLSALRSGEWLLALVQRTLRDSRAEWQAEATKLGAFGPDAAIRKLTHAAARRAALAGIVAATAVSVDELVALLTAGEGGVGLPANLAFAVASIGAELFFLTRLQVKLVEQIGVIYGRSSQLNSSEDVVAAFAIALGGLDTDVANGLAASPERARQYLSENINQRLKQVARRLGMRLVRRSVVKAAFPMASIAMSASSNYKSTLAVADAARKYFARRD